MVHVPTVHGFQSVRHGDGFRLKLGQPLSVALVNLNEVYRLALEVYTYMYIVIQVYLQRIELNYFNDYYIGLLTSGVVRYTLKVEEVRVKAWMKDWEDTPVAGISVSFIKGEPC